MTNGPSGLIIIISNLKTSQPQILHLVLDLNINGNIPLLKTLHSRGISHPPLQLVELELFWAWSHSQGKCSSAKRQSCQLDLASFAGPAQLYIACSTEKQGCVLALCN